MTLRQWFKQHLFCSSCGCLRLYPAQCRQCSSLICDLCADPYGRLGYSPGKGLCPACRNAPSRSLPPSGGSVISRVENSHESQQDFFSSEAFRALLEAIEQQYGKIEYVTVCHLPDNPDEEEGEGEGE